MKKTISMILASAMLSASICTGVYAAPKDLKDITGEYYDALVSSGIAGSSTTEYHGTENSGVSIESVKTLSDHCIIITLDSYFPDFDINDLGFQAYNSDWYSLKPKLSSRITYSDYNVSVNDKGNTVVTVLINENINNDRLESDFSDKTQYTDSEKAEVIKKADNEMTWQLDCGGWDKDYEIHQKRAWDGKEDKITHGWKSSDGTPLGTIDNDGTYSEMADIALAYALTEDSKYKASFEKGLEFLKKLQYPSGGFAQVYPRRGNYSDYVTLNDDAMVAVMIMLEKIQDKRFPYNTGIVTQENYDDINTMLEKATDYLIKSQIVCKGELSAWCAQHDPVTYEPKPARAYELESISGSESIGAIKYLMNQHNDKEAVAAAEAAIKWFDAHKMENTGFDAYAKEDTDGDGKINYFFESPGNTLWYRFYDVNTGEGFFSDRDSEKYKDIADISEERRTGYAWSGNWPGKIIDVYNEYGYYADAIVVSVKNANSKDINGKTLLKSVSVSPTEDNLVYTLENPDPKPPVEQVKYGDADNSGGLDSADAAAILQKVLKSTYKMPVEDVTPDWMTYIDVTADGQLNSADAAAVLQKVLKSTYKLPVEENNA